VKEILIVLPLFWSGMAVAPRHGLLAVEAHTTPRKIGVVTYPKRVDIIPRELSGDTIENFLQLDQQ
jgi:hypothetical protein